MPEPSKNKITSALHPTDDPPPPQPPDLGPDWETWLFPQTRQMDARREKVVVEADKLRRSGRAMHDTAGELDREARPAIAAIDLLASSTGGWEFGKALVHLRDRWTGRVAAMTGDMHNQAAKLDQTAAFWEQVEEQTSGRFRLPTDPVPPHVEEPQW
ncbi:type VII secretion target [Streptomyces sp. SID3343]|uniref:type VII secretion target n=1 Tax=Streptomyces sp. SID3343 TaxID=2690260 RepID=UPI001371AB20|nr:type VII secretion target [Streptomyces sp. SID3343]MYW04989.1 hypothetical protein [Streptomyces sp. SID3343]